MNRRFLSLCTLVVFVFLSSLAPIVVAQANGVISGVVNGPGGPLRDVTVNIINSSGTVVGTQTTTALGAYSVGSLPLGTYTIQVVGQTGGVISTSTGIVSANLVAATVNITLTASQLAAAGLGAGAAAGAGILGLSTGTVLAGGAVVAGASGLVIYNANKADSSPTR